MTPSPGVVLRCVRLSSSLQPYLDGEITDPERVRAMAEHLEECRRCGLEAVTYAAVKVALAARARPGRGSEPGASTDAAGSGSEAATRAAVGRLEDFARSLAGPA